MLTLRVPVGEYTAEDVRFLESSLDVATGVVKALMLRMLCRFGNPISRYAHHFEGASPVVRREIMTIAEAQGDAETVASLADENYGNVNEVIMVLKRMGRTDCLAPLIFSDNREVAELVRDMESE